MSHIYEIDFISNSLEKSIHRNAFCLANWTNWSRKFTISKTFDWQTEQIGIYEGNRKSWIFDIDKDV